MSGHISGVQARLTDLNAKAIFVNSDNHSLNSWSSCCFRGSAHNYFLWHRWAGVRLLWVYNSVEKDGRKAELYCEERVRHTVECEGISCSCYCSIVWWELLQEMSEDALQSADTREKAGTLLNSLLTLSFVCFLILWEHVLHKINVVQKRLQSPRMNLRYGLTDRSLYQQVFRTVLECYKQGIKCG